MKHIMKGKFGEMERKYDFLKLTSKKAMRTFLFSLGFDD